MNVFECAVARGILRGVLATLEELQDYLCVHGATPQTQKAVGAIRDAARMVQDCLTEEQKTHAHELGQEDRT